MKITIVTSIINIPYGKTVEEIIRGFNAYFPLFAGTKICLYVDPKFNFKTHNSNVRIMNYEEKFENTWIHKLCDEITYELPKNRNEQKDSNEFIISGQTKYDFILDTIEKNPWDSDYFIWADSTIFEIIKNPEETKAFFEWLPELKWNQRVLTFPGCWSKLEKEKSAEIFDSVHWRFCGGFFAGDKTSISQFCELYKTEFTEFFKTHKKLVWDFNFWAWMEANIEGLDFGWYKADHNDSIFMITADSYVTKLSGIMSKKEYNYPKIQDYYPTSASYLYHDGHHWLNTRYVNYWIYPSGCYLFHNPDRVIENKNILSELEDETFSPFYFREVEENISLPVTKGISSGLEDVRLYSVGNQVKYIATTAGYSPDGKSRMIIGKYDLTSGQIQDGTIILPPDSNADSWCEKNWIPIVKKEIIPMLDEMITDAGYICEVNEEFYVYKWSPMEIGKINPQTHKLEIVRTHKMKNPIFSRIRGSTTFTEINGGLIGLVHYSEEHSPRHYYHMLVFLDKDSFRPIKYSEPFYFEKLGIEFCIGMNVDPQIEDRYRFWISRHDRDPVMLEVDGSKIRWFYG